MQTTRTPLYFLYGESVTFISSGSIAPLPTQLSHWVRLG